MIDITRYNIKSSKILQDLSILLVTDVHNQVYDQLIRMIEEINYKDNIDFIILGGDISEGNCKDIEALLDTCVNMTKTVYTRGNHEWEYGQEDINFIEAKGCYFLENNFMQFDNNVIIGGLASPLKYENNGIFPEYHRPIVEWIDRFEQQDGLKILCSHHPEYYEEYLMKRDMDLILSGHAHGGQIRLFNRGLWAPGQGLFPKYTSGIVDDKFIISRGLANTSKIIPRINNKKEVVYISIEKING